MVKVTSRYTSTLLICVCTRRWAFLVQLPLLAVSFVLVIWKANIKVPDQPSTLRAKMARIDWLGSLTLVTSVASLLLSVSLKSAEELPWSHPLVWGLFITFIVAGAAFVLVEIYVSPEPIMPMRLLVQRTPLAVALSNFFTSITAYSIIYNIPLYFSAVRLQSASEAGLHLLPQAVSREALFDLLPLNSNYTDCCVLRKCIRRLESLIRSRKLGYPI